MVGAAPAVTIRLLGTGLLGAGLLGAGLLTVGLLTAGLLATSGADEVAALDVEDELLALHALTAQIVKAAATIPSLRPQVSISMSANATR